MINHKVDEVNYPPQTNIEKLTFRALALRQSESIHRESDEGLTLETSAFKSFTVANLSYRLCTVVDNLL